MLNTRVEKNVTLGVREFWAKWSRIKQKKKIFWTVAPVLDKNRTVL